MLDKIKEGLKQVLNDIEDRFDEKNFVDEPEKYPVNYEPYLEEEDEEYNPYEECSYAGCEWFCLRCGSKLNPIAKDDKYWGDMWNLMKKDGTLYFLCDNKDCGHHGAPLVLHHPIKGYRAPAGDSYSISWVK